MSVPPLVGYLLLGVAVSLLDNSYHLISPAGHSVFEFLASVGLIALLFRVGLESNVHVLFDKLGRAVPIWIGNVALSGVPAYYVAREFLELALVPSLFIAVAR